MLQLEVPHADTVSIEYCQEYIFWVLCLTAICQSSRVLRLMSRHLARDLEDSPVMAGFVGFTPSWHLGTGAGLRPGSCLTPQARPTVRLSATTSKSVVEGSTDVSRVGENPFNCEETISPLVRSLSPSKTIEVRPTGVRPLGEKQPSKRQQSYRSNSFVPFSADSYVQPNSSSSPVRSKNRSRFMSQDGRASASWLQRTPPDIKSLPRSRKMSTCRRSHVVIGRTLLQHPSISAPRFSEPNLFCASDLLPCQPAKPITLGLDFLVTAVRSPVPSLCEAPSPETRRATLSPHPSQFRGRTQPTTSRRLPWTFQWNGRGCGHEARLGPPCRAAATPEAGESHRVELSALRRSVPHHSPHAGACADTGNEGAGREGGVPLRWRAGLRASGGRHRSHGEGGATGEASCLPCSLGGASLGRRFLRDSSRENTRARETPGIPHADKIPDERHLAKSVRG